MKAKKSLGQNFLKGEFALKKIIEAGEMQPGDIILEIGPGKGALTKKLLEKSSLVIAVEKDNNLFSFLQEKFTNEISDGKLILLNEDILEFDMQKTISKIPVAQRFLHGLVGVGLESDQKTDSKENRGPEKTFVPQEFNYKIIANIPYNITGAILKKFLTAENQPVSMVLMVQLEVAKRIIARDKKESILSVSVKAYGEPKMVAKVPARYFSPAPKVDSAIIAINNISRKNFKNSPLEEYSDLSRREVDKFRNTSTPSRKRATPQEGNKNFEEKFWEIVKAGFAHKRKKLSSNLKTILKNRNASLLPDFVNKRAEELSTKDWLALASSGIINP